MPFRQASTINLLVGGGCDDRKEYVELVADGIGVAKATGRCTEDMRSVRYGRWAPVGRWKIDERIATTLYIYDL